MPEEKFVTIPFVTWESKYKPMEEQLNRTQRWLQEEKDKKIVQIHVRSDYPDMFNHYCSYYSKREIRVLDITFNSKYLESKEIVDKLRSFLRGPLNNTEFITKEELYSMDNKIRIGMEQLDHKQAQILERIKNLPRIVRWLFKIR